MEDGLYDYLKKMVDGDEQIKNRLYISGATIEIDSSFLKAISDE